MSGMVGFPNFLSYDINPGLSPSMAPAYSPASYPTMVTSANGQTMGGKDYTDVRVYHNPAGDTVQAEEQIAINPTNPQNMIISANTIVGEQGYYVSSDGGNTWQGANSLPTIHNTTTILGDPSVAFDAQGNAYISTLKYYNSHDADGYYVIKSSNGGTSWNNKVPGLSYSSPGFDKEMITGDPNSNHLYAVWDSVHVVSNTDANVKINFNYSIDGGQNFSTPKHLSQAHNGFGPDVAVGPSGQIYVCWEDLGTGSDPSKFHPSKGIMFDESTDGGMNFNGPFKAFSVNGMDPNGNQGDPNFHNTRVNDAPSIAVDLSNDSHQGRIYIAYAEEVNGKSVIRVRHSDDEGTSWSSPVTVSGPNAVQAWFPWIAVARSTGIVSVAYYYMNFSSNWSTDTWVAYSFDGGQTFQTSKVSDVSHVTEPIDNSCSTCNFAISYAGDYIGIAAMDSSAWATWADQRNGMWQVYVSRIDYVTVPLNFTLTGPTKLANGEQGTWTASAYGGTPGYTYNWQYYYICKTTTQPDCPGCGQACGQWFYGGSASTFQLSASTVYAGVNVKVTVTDQAGTRKTKEAAFCQFY